MIFMKCTKTDDAFLHCEELVAVAFVETNVDALFDSIQKKKNIALVRYYHIFLEINLKFSEISLKFLEINLK